MKNFLHKLQSADEHRKKRWIFGAAACAMIVVFYLWLAYFNSIIGTLATADAAQNQNFSFMDTMRNGAATVYQFFDDRLHAFGSILQAPRDYIVNPK